MNNKPNFICLGVHKCGTSWLYNCLYEHPEIDIQDKIDYFYRTDRYNKGTDWYAKFFQQAAEKISGDLSPVYFFNQTQNQVESTAQRIHRHNPNVKLIVLLRNPIDRAYSHYLQDLKTGHLATHTSFSQAIEQQPKMLSWGRYKTHIQSFLQVFRKEQILFLVFDDIINRPNQTIQEVYGFLGVNKNFIPSNSTKKINPARLPKYPKIDFYKRKISNTLKKNKQGERLWWQLKQSKVLAAYYKINSKKNSKLSLSDEKKRAFLASFYKEDIEFVKNLLNRHDLTWK